MAEMIVPTPARRKEKVPKASPGEPVWEIAYLYPRQGEWSESEYLALETNQLIEFDNGHLEFLPMPTLAHQFITLFLYRLLWNFIEARKLGQVLTAPLPVRLWPGKYREPDVLYLSAERLARLEGSYPNGADLVVEVVSGSVEDRERDLVTKRQEYAQAGIAEYWIVDPEQQQIIVLRLDGENYATHSVSGKGQQAASALLEDFALDVDAVFAEANVRRE